MSLECAEKKIEEYAKKNHNCATLQQAEDVLRTFYGLSPRVKQAEAKTQTSSNPPPEQPQERKPVSVALEDFF